jgi:hypothetical protein
VLGCGQAFLEWYLVQLKEGLEVLIKILFNLTQFIKKLYLFHNYILFFIINKQILINVGIEVNFLRTLNKIERKSSTD